GGTPRDPALHPVTGSCHRVDQPLDVRRPPAVIPLLELRDPPVGALDHLPAPVAGAVTAHDPVAVDGAHRVVGEQLGSCFDVGHRGQGVLVDPAEVGVAGVVAEPV